MPLDQFEYINLKESPFATPVERLSSTSPVTAPDSDPVAAYVERRFDQMKRFRALVDKKWNAYYRVLEGQQWSPGDLTPVQTGRDAWRAKYAVNYSFEIIQSTESTLMDNEPKVSVAATHPLQMHYVQNLQSAIDSIWQRRSVAHKVSDAIITALTLGTGVLKIFWNWDLENGEGDIDVEFVPLEHMFVDEQCTDFYNANCIIEATPRPIAYFQQRWPELAHLIHSDASVKGSYQRHRIEDNRSVFGNSPLKMKTPVGDDPLVADNVDYSNPPYISATSTEQNWSLLLECWVKDPTQEVQNRLTTTGVDMYGQPIVEMRQMPVDKYPYGRLIHVAGGVVLDDVPSPYRVWPYVRFVDIRRPGQFWGKGEVELLWDLQLELNKRRCQMTDFATQMGNAVWVVDKGALVDSKMLNNKPGLVVEKNAGFNVTRLPPPPMPAWMPQLAETTVRDMHKISGVSDVSSGTPPKGVRSGAGFQMAQDIGNARIRSKGRNMGMSYKHMGRIMVSLLQDMYTAPRYTRIIGSDMERYIEPFFGPNARGDWDVMVEAGSESANTQAAQQQNYMQLYGMGAIDLRTLLEKLGIPEVDKVIARVMDPQNMLEQTVPRRMAQQGPQTPYSTDRTGYSSAVRLAAPAPPGPPPGAAGPGGGGGGAQGGYVGGTQGSGGQNG